MRAALTADGVPIIAADRIQLDTCKHCDHIHVNLYEEIGIDHFEMFATATIGLDQLDDFVHKLSMLRNKILKRKDQIQ